MKRKKLLALGLSLILALSLMACGSSDTSSDDDAEDTAEETEAEEEDEDEDSEDSESSTGLIAEEYLTGDYTTLPEDGETITLTLGHAAAETSQQHVTAQAFAEAIEYYSDGKITVTIYPNGQLGSDSEMISSMLAGDIDIVCQAGSTHLSYVSEAAIFDTPFLLTDYDNDALTSVCIDSEFRDLYDAANEEAGIKLLQLRANVSMNLTSNKAVYSMDDLAGLKIRTAQSESRMAIWEDLGANPTPLAFSELYLALQNGTVDAQDNVWENAVTSGAAEQQKYMIPTAHMQPSTEWLMNLEVFESLPEEYQALIEEIADDINLYDIATSTAADEDYYNQLIDEYGLEVCEVSDEFAADMVEAAQDAIQDVHDTVGNEELYEVLEECLEAASE